LTVLRSGTNFLLGLHKDEEMEILERMTDVLTSSRVSVPLSQVIALLILSTLALLFGRFRLALLVNYCFTFYWGYFLNFDLFTEKGAILNINTFAYFGLGFGILLIALFTLCCHRE